MGLVQQDTDKRCDIYGKDKSFITGNETTEASSLQGGDGFINDDYDGCFKR